MESGIEIQTISVLRQLPRNSRIIKPVRPAAIRASRTTPWIEARTKTRLVGERHHLQLRRNVGQDSGKCGLHRIDDGQSGSLPVPGDGHQNAARSVGADDIVLDRESVVNLRDVFDVYRCAVNGLDRQVVQFVEPHAGCC